MDGLERGARPLRQQRYYEEECDPEFEVTRPRDCGRVYEFLISHKVDTGLGLLGGELAGKRVLEVCCGSGMVSESLARSGAKVTAVDFSTAAIARAHERMRRYDFEARFFVADAEALPFASDAFDLVVVHDGLHHLDDPYRAVAEMGRVASEGVLVLEPARAFLTSLAVRLGLAEEVEEAGNYVRRLAPKKVARCLRAAGFERVSWKRTLMYYPHRPFAWFRWFDGRARFSLFRALFWGANALVGRWGNKLAVGATRGRA